MTHATPAPDLPQLFAEIAPRFGISRPAGQCFAAIWRAAQAPAAEDLVRILGISRSNVSTALKELRGLGLVQIARSPGSRRDFYVAPADPWALLRQLLAERQRRDLAPLAARLHDLQAASGDARLADLAQVLDATSGWLAQLAAHSPEELAAMMHPVEHGKKKKKKRARD
ncbi:MarR family transcriptional regulator [Paenirhodobacter sp. CAU 1674]|jgi:DNA-binding transcriptional regulator GbsR (MarR family)|uniref:GbsR/MarR family transcriptional regulator n=1 Tax=Paenirhodobacter sp. CAU 1674 TaxID=3032596 RepID=UPI0023DABAEE|nr:MarR family transcriptional regulator [Paenirhodobacter sp. CAU 1674]MDF2142258.1 MarR family transcriptional regulator [Paenirhodobacter sp. CAU 1674]